MRAPLRIPRPSRIQFTLRGMMVAAAIAGLILGFLAWLAGWVFDFIDFLALLVRPAPTGVSHGRVIIYGRPLRPPPPASPACLANAVSRICLARGYVGLGFSRLFYYLQRSAAPGAESRKKMINHK